MANEIMKIHINKNYKDKVGIKDIRNLDFYTNEFDASNQSNKVNINFDYLDDDNLYIDSRGRVYSSGKESSNIIGWINKDDVIYLMNKSNAEIKGVDVVSLADKVNNNEPLQGVRIVPNDIAEAKKNIEGVKIVSVADKNIKGVNIGSKSSLQGVRIGNNDKEGSA